MGGKHGAKCLHALPVELKQLAEIGLRLARQNNMNMPIIDTDFSNICFRKDKSVESAINFMAEFAEEGFCVFPVADGKRPICKQATNERIATREEARIMAAVLKKQLIQRNHEFAEKQSSMDEDERVKIRTELAKLETSMKSKETCSRSSVPPNAVEQLEKEIATVGAHLTSTAGGSISHVLKAEFQADAVMMGRMSSGMSLMVITTDADIPMLGGDQCLAVKELTGGKLHLVSTSLETLTNARNQINEKDRVHTKIIPAKCPLFDGIADRKTRAIIHLILGCDVYAKGIPGVGASTLKTEIDEN